MDENATQSALYRSETSDQQREVPGGFAGLQGMDQKVASRGAPRLIGGSAS